MGYDELGRVVRDAWVEWARTQPEPKPSWLVPYDQLPEADKEADRQIGEAVFHHLVGLFNKPRFALIEKKNRGGLTPAEAEEFKLLQELTFRLIDAVHPHPQTLTAKLDALERRLGLRPEGEENAQP